MNTGDNKPDAIANTEPAPDQNAVRAEERAPVIEKPSHTEVMPANRPRKVYGGMWGRAELAVFGVSLLSILGLLLFYLFVVAPSGKELAETKATRDSLEQQLISAQSKYGSITNTETQVAKLVSSVNDFESAYLPVAITGQTALYQRLNGLIAGYGLVNTNGPNYTPLVFNEQQNAGNGENSEEKQGREKFRSIFPGVYVTMTVEGSYQNLRRFIREIETAGEFVIISSVELEPTETKKKEEVQGQQPTEPQQAMNQGFPGNPTRGNFGNPTAQMQPQQQQPERQQGKTHGETVSLRLEMAAYFRRANAAPPVTEGEQ